MPSHLPPLLTINTTPRIRIIGSMLVRLCVSPDDSPSAVPEAPDTTFVPMRDWPGCKANCCAKERPPLRIPASSWACCAEVRPPLVEVELLVDVGVVVPVDVGVILIAVLVGGVRQLPAPS